MDPVATKDFFQSKTTWGFMLPMLNSVLLHFGYQLPTDDGTLTAFVNGAGAAMFLWGQTTRTATIGTVAGISIGPAVKP